MAIDIQSINGVNVSFTLNKSTLATVKQALDATAKRSRLPILESILFTFDGNTVTLYATNLELYYHSSFTIDTYTSVPFSIVVHRNSLKGVKNGTRLTFTESSYTVNGITFKPSNMPEDMPKFPTLVQDETRTNLVDWSYFHNLQSVSVACAQSEVRPVLTGVYHNQSSIVATDGLRLHMSDVSTMFETSFNLPQSAVKLLTKTFAASGATLTYDTNFAHYTHDNTEMYVRLIDGKYPDISRIMPTNGGVTGALSNVNGWIATLRNVAKMKIGSNETRFDFISSECTLSATNKDTGASLETVVPFDGNGGQLIAANAEYMADALEHVGDNCIVLLNGDNKPMLYTSADGTRKALVSPVFMR